MARISWEAIKQRYDELGITLSDPTLKGSKRLQLQKEYAFLSALLNKKVEFDELDKKIDEAKEAAAASEDEEFLQLCAEEQEELEAHRLQKEQEFNDLLFPPDEHDNRSVYLEIRAGAGGQEAALFASNLLKMYTNYALERLESFNRRFQRNRLGWFS